MQDLFVTKIHVGKVRNIENIDITLSDTERKHLILTGKNGSGKTSLISALYSHLNWLPEHQKLDSLESKPNGDMTASYGEDIIDFGYNADGQLKISIFPNTADKKKFAVANPETNAKEAPGNQCLGPPC